MANLVKRGVAKIIMIADDCLKLCVTDRSTKFGIGSLL